MEVFGGFMVMLSILGFFLTVIWFVLPFVVFAMKGKLDRTYLLLEEVERRLSAIEERLKSAEAPQEKTASPADSSQTPPSAAPPSSEEG